jgi:hypothetical protein
MSISYWQCLQESLFDIRIPITPLVLFTVCVAQCCGAEAGVGNARGHIKLVWYIVGQEAGAAGNAKKNFPEPTGIKMMRLRITLHASYKDRLAKNPQDIITIVLFPNVAAPVLLGPDPDRDPVERVAMCVGGLKGLYSSTARARLMLFTHNQRRSN